MDIAKFIKYLNKEKGWKIDASYYADISMWKDWWRGYYKPFHMLKTVDGTGEHKRQLYSMRMPKKICEDWASLLMNERTSITVNDDASQKWLIGDNEDNGLLGKLGFWQKANELVELTFRSGTGAFVMMLENAKLDAVGNFVRTPNAAITIDYLPAECIIPITIRHKKIVEVAFVSEILVNGQSCIYLQTHQLKSGGYKITNEYFTSRDANEDTASYEAAKLPPGVLRNIYTNSNVPWFSILQPNIVKNIPRGTGMGMAVFAEALDQVKAVDKAFNNLVKDIELGGKKIFYKQSLIKDIPDINGNMVKVTPDDIMQQLFLKLGDEDDINEKNPITEYNPSLRVAENVDAVQNALNYLSFKCGLGTHHYQFDGASITTATQYSGDRQDMKQNARKHEIFFQEAVAGIVRAVLWAGKTILGAPVNPDAEITVTFDDGYFTDSETLRTIMSQEVRDGILPKWKYAAKWYNLAEDEAKALVAEAQGETESTPGLFGGE